MYAIEFQTRIRDGVIEIPAEEREALAAQVNGGLVRVIVMAPEKKQTPATTKAKIDLVQDAKDKGYDSFVDYLLDHPVQISESTYMTREESHERSTYKPSLADVAREQGYDSFIAYLRDHPLHVDDPTPLTREEIYDRRNF